MLSDRKPKSNHGFIHWLIFLLFFSSRLEEAAKLLATSLSSTGFQRMSLRPLVPQPYIPETTAWAIFFKLACCIYPIFSGTRLHERCILEVLGLFAECSYLWNVFGLSVKRHPIRHSAETVCVWILGVNMLYLARLYLFTSGVYISFTILTCLVVIEMAVYCVEVRLTQSLIIST